MVRVNVPSKRSPFLIQSEALMIADLVLWAGAVPWHVFLAKLKTEPGMQELSRMGAPPPPA